MSTLSSASHDLATMTVPTTFVLPLSGEGLPTADQVRREISEVFAKTLSPELAHWAARYSEVGRRNVYLWKWCRQGVEVTSLPCVRPELFDSVCDTKVLGVMLDVLLDDIADRNGDDALLETLLSVSLRNPEPDLSAVSERDQPYARLTVEVWREIVRRAKSYPCFDQYARLLDFDYQQLFNVMSYSHLVNRDLEMLNLAEHDVYTPHNMHIMISSTLDLMCSPEFDRSELGLVRDAVWHAQCMGRIGNLTTTWERELGESDYSSGVYASALASGDLTLADLRQGDREKIKRAIVEGGHEIRFLRNWQEHRRYLRSRVPHIRSFDLGRVITGYERLICLHLGSRGYK